MVAEHGSFTAAAAAAGQSQPALSQALSTLEAGLGKALFTRGNRRLELTTEGARLLPLARAAMAAAEAVVAAAAEHDTEIPVRLGIIPTAAPYLLGPLLQELSTQHPSVAPLIVEDRTADLVDAVRSGEIDCAIVALPIGESGLNEVPLYTEEFVLAVSPGHHLLDAKTVTPAVLDEEAMLLLDQGHCLREQIIEMCRANNARVLGATASRVTTLASAVHCVAAGLGVTVLPATAVATELAHTSAEMVKFAAPVPSRTMGLISRRGVPEQLIHIITSAFSGAAVSSLPIMLADTTQVS